jgi:hypothetical protein
VTENRTPRHVEQFVADHITAVEQVKGLLSGRAGGAWTAALVLQLHIIIPAFGPALVVMQPCSSLVHSAPAGPRQHMIGRCVGAQVKVQEQPLDLRYSERD